MQTRKYRILLVLILVIGMFGMVALIAGQLSPPDPLVIAIHITNVNDGETLSYPLAMLSGYVDLDPPSLPGAKRRYGVFVPRIQVLNRDRPVPTDTTSVSVIRQRFTLLVTLTPGLNQLEVSVGKVQKTLTLNYRPSTSPYQVRIAYVLPSDGEIGFPGYTPKSREDYEDKLDTAAKLMQTFTAEEMNRQGLGHRTFTLELDKNGRVVVHTLRFSADTATFRRNTGDVGRGLFLLLQPWIDQQFSDRYYKTLVIPAIDGPGGGRGRDGMALTQAPYLAFWPRHIADVSQREFQQNNVYTMGEIQVALHELGHSFGAEHSAVPNSIMRTLDFSLGADFTSPQSGMVGAHWDEYDLAHFYYLPWFQPEGHRFDVGTGPLARMGDQHELIVQSRRGIGAINLYTPSDSKDEEAPIYTLRHQILYKTNPPPWCEFTAAQLKSWLGPNPMMHVLITDTEGNTTFCHLDR